MFLTINIKCRINKIIKAFIVVLSYSMRHFRSAELPSGSAAVLCADFYAPITLHFEFIGAREMNSPGPHFNLFPSGGEKRAGFLWCQLKQFLPDNRFFLNLSMIRIDKGETRRMDPASVYAIDSCSPSTSHFDHR